MKKSALALLFGVAACGAPTVAFAAESTISAADTGFMIVATALVLLMTVPGLALFYAGMVRKKNVLATMAQSFAATALISILWFAGAYSLAFHGEGAFLGDLGRAFFHGIGMETVSPLAKSIPELLFAAYQMTFAVITCALVAGGVADRLKFSAFLIFSAIWLFVVYVPTAHWMWGGGFLSQWGAIDFAGGVVVHINAGVAGLVCAYVVGKRQGYGKENLAPFDLTLAAIGTGLLWVGWFGFNGGSALGAGSRAVFAIVATHLAACAGAIVWSGLEWIERGKPSVLGIISGAIAGLGTVTPASGFILPWHGLAIGLIAGAVCYYFCTRVKFFLQYDDSLDVFGVHGVGGVLGTLAAGVFATASVSASGSDPGVAGLLEGAPRLLAMQAAAIVIVVAWGAVGTWLALKITDALTGLRVSREDERMGLDLALHGEAIHQ